MTETNEKLDLVIKNGLIITGGGESGIIPNGYVGIADGTIKVIGPMDGMGEIEAEKVIDAGSGLVMPGLVNAHTHTPMTCFRGLADDLDLDTWLNDHIFPAEAAHVNEDLVYWGAKLAASEMLLSGTTCVVDGYFLEDEAFKALSESGMRAIVGQGVIDFPAPGVPDPSQNIQNAARFVDRWQDASSLVKPSVFCHSPYTCSDETLIKGKKLANEKGVLFQVHVAETKREVEECLADKGKTTVEYLNSLEILDQSTLAVHCVHLSETDMDILAEKGTPIAVCSESNHKLASGVPNIPLMLKSGITVSLGTDGAASNNNLNMFGEIRTAALMQKYAELDPTILPADQAFALATSGGAKALGMKTEIGRLAAGYKADIVILDMDRPNMRPLYNPYSHLAYAATGREVKTVIVQGRLLVDDGRFLAFDLPETLARVREIAERIRT